MSITITIVTTANRTRRFTQSDPARVSEILDSLRRCAQLFSSRSLGRRLRMPAPKYSARQPSRASRFETDTDLTPYLPHGQPHRYSRPRAGRNAADHRVFNRQPNHRDAEPTSIFEGGDSLNTWSGPKARDRTDATEAHHAHHPPL
jgi:hypothetical protein